MKVACLSDLHLVGAQPQCRTDNIVVDQWTKLEYVFDYATEVNCKAVVQAGDLTDSARSWSVLPQLINFLSVQQHMRFYGVYGQHDTYMYSETSRDRTNLGVLASGHRAKILSARPVRLGGVRFYGASWGQAIPKPKNRKYKNVLVVHAPIGPEVYPGHETTSAERFLKKHDRFDLIVCGDVHRAFTAEVNGRHIINTGPLVRKWADDYMLRHRPHFYVWDSATGELQYIDIPAQPSEEVISRDHIREEREDHTELVREFVEALNTTNRGVDIEAIVTEVLDRLQASTAVANIVTEELSEVYHANNN
jgi:DNA repair exonuclease SbcCD nuclease subunit